MLLIAFKKLIFFIYKHQYENLKMEEITEDNLTIDILKRRFPKCKWNDASNRDHNEIHKIVKICWDVEDLYIFIKRNKKNSIFFGEILIQEISKEFKHQI